MALIKAQPQVTGKFVSKIDHSLFNANEHALQQAFGMCPKCNGALGVRRGKSGAFIGCSQYPQCDYTKPLHDNETSTVKSIDGSVCPSCSSLLEIKKGRYGLFIGCSDFPSCEYIESINKQKEQIATSCPSCKQGRLLKRTNKFGKFFYACDNYPQCKYVVNLPPFEQSCPVCEWPIMLQKTRSKETHLQCPQKHCQHKMPIP